MSDKKNNNKYLSNNQAVVTQDVTSKCKRGKKVEKLQPKLFKEDLGFTQLLNETINAIQDAEALGVYCYLASKPEEWEISKQQLRNNFNMGVNKIDAIFTKLRSFGLIEMIPVKDEQGKIILWDYYLKARITIPMETTPMESMAMENTPPINKEYINKDIINNNIYIEPKKKNSYSEQFESFWAQSNKRGEKVKAYAAWKANKLDNKLDLMIDLLKNNYSLKFGDRELKYLPHISTWINYRPWEEGSVKTQDEIIAKACEQLQSTKDNLPVQINNIEPIISDFKRFKTTSLRFGLAIKDNLIEAFLEALKARNIPIHESHLEIILEELQKIKFEGLDVNECIKKFLMSSWKSFSIDYFKKDKTKRPSLSNPFALHNLQKNKE